MMGKTVTDIPKLPARRPDAHKGDFGRILVVGGCTGMIGAPALAANAALRGGAGLVTIAVPSCVQDTVASLAWCATSIGLAYDESIGCISESAIDPLLKTIVDERRFDVVAVGPGLGATAAVNRLIVELIDADVPIVVDADALNNLSKTNWHGLLAGRCVITPHPGELARMLAVSTNDIQSARQESAQRAVQLMADGNFDRQAVCLLKGAGTIITDGRNVKVNPTGNPGMATGGSGDVLTGVIAALIGQGLRCYEAAVLGAYVHGLAGDIAAEQLSQTAMTAEDILNGLPAAFKQLQTG